MKRIRRIKFVGIAIVVPLSLAVSLAASASAATLPNVLPEGTATEPVTAVTSSGESEFGNGFIKLTSKKSTGTQSDNSTKLGSFTNKFRETKDTLGSACKGSKDTEAETVTVSGTFHIRDYKEGTSLRTATIFLLNEAKFSCGSLEITTVGCVAGALTPESKLTKTLTVTVARNGSLNDQKIVTILNESNTESETCQLLSKMGVGALELSSQVQTSTVTEFKKNGAAVEVEVMPL
jgi:hypothetical protein